jgi:hypothetical protein
VLGQRARRVVLRLVERRVLDQQPWPTRAAARRATVDYIAWYNGTRLHSALSYLTPDEFETTTREEPIKQVARPTHPPCPSNRGNPSPPEGHRASADHSTGP